MAWKLTINGTDQTAYVHLPNRVRMTLNSNERSMARFTLLDLIPTRFHEVVIYDTDGTTPIFGGVIQARSLMGLEEESASVLVHLSCADFGLYADWCYATQSHTSAVYLKAVLQELITENLGQYGITLATMADGPLLDPFEWKNFRVSDALRELTTRTGYVFAFSPTKVLSMVAPGTDAAPETITDADANCKSFGWADPTEVPPTKIRLMCGPSSGQYYYEETITCNGTDTHWHLKVMPSAEWGPGPWTVLHNGLHHDTIGVGASFTWDWTTGTLSLGTHATPANGDTLKIEYYVNYPFEIVEDSLDTPVVEMLASAEGALTYTQGLEIAQGMLAQNHEGREISVLSRLPGWRPAQKITVDRTDRNVDAFALITSVEIALTTDTYWEYTIKALEGTTFTETYLDKWRTLTGGVSSSSGTSVTGGSISPGSAYFHAHIGGSSSRLMNGESWVEIAEAKTCTAPASGDYTFRFEACTENAGTSITVRLYDETAGTVVASSTSSAITATTFAGGRTAVTVTLVAGHVYYAQYQNSNGTYGTLVRQASLEA
jgi:hypothetical protein